MAITERDAGASMREGLDQSRGFTDDIKIEITKALKAAHPKMDIRDAMDMTNIIVDGIKSGGAIGKILAEMLPQQDTTDAYTKITAQVKLASTPIAPAGPAVAAPKVAAPAASAPKMGGR